MRLLSVRSIGIFVLMAWYGGAAMARDPVAVYARIKMSSAQALYAKAGHELLSDYRCILKARKVSAHAFTEIAQLRDRTGGKTPSAADLQRSAALQKEALSLACDAGDWLVIRYDKATAALFYMHVFNSGTPSALKASQSFQTFLGNVAQYKDVKTKDFILVSDSATNLASSRFVEIWSVQPGKISPESAWTKDMTAQVKELDDLSKKYYFDIVDKHLQVDAKNQAQRVDESSLEKMLDAGAFDAELRKAAH